MFSPEDPELMPWAPPPRAGAPYAGRTAGPAAPWAAPQPQAGPGFTLSAGDPWFAGGWDPGPDDPVILWRPWWRRRFFPFGKFARPFAKVPFDKFAKAPFDKFGKAPFDKFGKW